MQLNFQAINGKSLLLIEDEPTVLQALKLLLGALGVKVTDFQVANEAIQALKDDSILEERQMQFDAVLCDLRMPSMDGLSTLSQIKQIRPDLKTILMSGHATNDEIEQAKNIGVNAFMSKPFSPDLLIETISKL